MVIQLNGNTLDISKPLVMGIVNLTADSFYDGGQFIDIENVMSQVEKLVKEGTEIIDLGAASSRPGSTELSVAGELDKLLPVFKLIRLKYPKLAISIDTWRSEVIKELAQEAQFIVNDISAFAWDKNLLKTVAEHNLPYILMHNATSIETMHAAVEYDDIGLEILKFFAEKLRVLRSFNIQSVIIDPGFGFAKNVDQNFELFKRLDVLQVLELPILVGISRKSMIYKTLKGSADTALNGTSVLNAWALNHGAKILRVHDAKEAKETITLYNRLNK